MKLFPQFKDKHTQHLFYALTALGFSSITTQILIVREFLSIFYGNELVFGIILGNWLLITGIGSWLGKRSKYIHDKIQFFIIAQIAIAVIPFFSIIAIRYLKNRLFLYGELVGLDKIFLFSFGILLSYRIISGFLLTFACVIFSKENDSKSIGETYFIDNIGDLLGGFFVSVILIYILNAMEILLLVLIINLGCAILIAFDQGYKKLGALSVCLVLLFSFITVTHDLETESSKLIHKGQDLLFHKDTPYGRLEVTNMSGVYNFYENGAPLFSTENVEASEETIHYALAQVESPKRVLLISGGVSGSILEIFKHNVESVDYIEIDPEIIDVAYKYTTNLNDKRINIHHIDGRRFLKTTQEQYDAIIVDLPDPNTAQINRYYTVEFFKEALAKLTNHGVLSLALSSSENYLNYETRMMHSSLYRSLDAVFEHIRIIPGEKSFYLASQQELTYAIAENLEKKGIETLYVNKYYLPDKITQDRINQAYNGVQEMAQINRDFSPVAYYYHLLYWLSQFSVQLPIVPIAIVCAIILFLSLYFVNPTQFSIMSTGFTGASLEILILIAFQIIYGYAYIKIGIIITAFMLGIVVGSYFVNKRENVDSPSYFKKVDLLFISYCIGMPFIFWIVAQSAHPVIILFSAEILFPLLTVLVGFGVGAQFALATRIIKGESIEVISGKIYTSDLLGSFFGSLLVSALLVPMFGIFSVAFGLAVLKGLSLVNFARRHVN